MSNCKEKGAFYIEVITEVSPEREQERDPGVLDSDVCVTLGEVLFECGLYSLVCRYRRGVVLPVVW